MENGIWKKIILCHLPFGGCCPKRKRNEIKELKRFCLKGTTTNVGKDMRDKRQSRGQKVIEVTEKV